MMQRTSPHFASIHCNFICFLNNLVTTTRAQHSYVIEFTRLYNLIFNPVCELFNNFNFFLSQHDISEIIISWQDAFVFCIFLQLRRLEYYEQGKALGELPEAQRIYTSQAEAYTIQLRVVKPLISRNAATEQKLKTFLKTYDVLFKR